jgi:hypothetical protein
VEVAVNVREVIEKLQQVATDLVPCQNSTCSRG